MKRVAAAVVVALLVASPARAGDPIEGQASNYPGTAGFIGQPTVALPSALGGRYVGREYARVRVCADRCVVLPAVDWCQCYWGSSDRRVIDLSYGAWELVTDVPLSQGIIRVTVETAITTTLPDTSTRGEQ